MGSTFLLGQDVDSLLHEAHLIRNTKIDSAIALTQYALKLSKKQNSKYLIGRSYCHLGNLYRIKHNETEAISILKKGVKVCQKTGDSITLSKIYNNVGLTFKQTGQYDSAIAYFHHSIGNNTSDEAQALHNIGAVYRSMGKYEQALQFFGKAFTLYQQAEDTMSIAKMYNAIGSIHFDKGEFQKAKDYFFKFVNLVSDKDRYKTSIVLGNIGTTYEALNQLDSAFLFTMKALNISREINDQIGVMINLTNSANILVKQNKKLAAIRLYEQALAMADSLGSRNDQKDIYFVMSRAYEQLYDYKNSLAYYKLYEDLEDSLLNESTQETIVKIREKYNATEREKDIIKLRSEKEKHIEQNRFYKLLAYSIGALSVLILTSTLLIIRVTRKRKQAEHDKQVVYAMLEAEESERERISQEIHDSLGSKLGFIRMTFSTLKSLIPEEKYDPIDQAIVQSAEVSRDISHKLFASELRDMGLIPALRELFDNHNSLSPFQTFSTKFNNDQKVRLPWDVEINLYRITQELLNNTMKYASAKEVYVQINIDNKKLNYLYQDDGAGFDLSMVRQGVGLKSIENRVGRLDAEIDIKTSPGKGFRLEINVEIPGPAANYQ